MALSRQSLRHFALTNTLFPETSLTEALNKLGFVQADPIRSPARAQDLILRQRVLGYRVGDLDAAYTSAQLDEDFLYAYGYFAPRVQPLLYPKNPKRLTSLEKKLLTFIQEKGVIHPRELEQEFGGSTTRNWWGGNSKTTKIALDQLHYYGFIRVAGRVNGVRTYRVKPTLSLPNKALAHSEQERVHQLALLIVSILQPVTEVTFRQAISYLRYFYFNREKYTARYLIETLLKTHQITREIIDGIAYIWLPTQLELSVRKPFENASPVRLLAPFDPLVWDRVRFEHLWGWQYRFEAYTPAVKRLRGYYAMPLLWNDEIIGWANARVMDGTLKVEPGYISKEPQSAHYKKSLAQEEEKMQIFLRRSNR